MRISHLKEFVTLANYSKLTSAARALYISPSALSQHLAALEKELGCELFSRENNFTLTRKGEQALERAQKILFEYGGMLRDCADEEAEEVRISVPALYRGHAPVAVAREAFLEKHPTATVALSSNTYVLEDPVEVLKSGASDISFLFVVRDGKKQIADLVPEGVEWARFGSEECLFACTSDHPLATKAVLTAQDLDGRTVVTSLCPASSILIEGITDVLEQHHVTIQPSFKRITHNSDAFFDDISDELVLWLRPTEGSPQGVDLQDDPAIPFERDIIADAYLLYRPASLSPLQLEYLNLVKELHKSGRAYERSAEKAAANA